MKNPTAVIFDFGDTLVSYPLASERGQLDLIQTFFKDFLQNKPHLKFNGTIDDLANRLNTENDDNSVWPFVERVCSESFFGSSIDTAEAVELERQICEVVFRGAERFNDAMPYLKNLKEAEITTGIVSNLPWGTNSTIWKEEFTRHGFDESLINEAVCCVDAGFRKPHPAALQTCMKKLGVKPEETYYVGDRMSDVETAKLSGCSPVWLNRNDMPREGYSGEMVNSLEELAQIHLG